MHKSKLEVLIDSINKLQSKLFSSSFLLFNHNATFGDLKVAQLLHPRVLFIVILEELAKLRQNVWFELN